MRSISSVLWGPFTLFILHFLEYKPIWHKFHTSMLVTYTFKRVFFTFLAHLSARVRFKLSQSEKANFLMTFTQISTKSFGKYLVKNVQASSIISVTE